MHSGPSFFKACAFFLAATATLINPVQAADANKLDSVLKRGHLVVEIGRAHV